MLNPKTLVLLNASDGFWPQLMLCILTPKWPSYLTKIQYTQITYLVTGEQIFPKNLLSLQQNLDSFSVNSVTNPILPFCQFNPTPTLTRCSVTFIITLGSVTLSICTVPLDVMWLKLSSFIVFNTHLSCNSIRNLVCL